MAIAVALLWPARAQAGGPNISPEATEGLDLLFSGQTDTALVRFQQMEARAPDDPLTYLLEAEARWWRIYCATCEIKWNMIDSWKVARGEESDAYLAATDKATRLAEARIAQNDTAEMELYAGMGWMLRARALGLENVRRATAEAGVKARAHMLRCLELDPQMADAYTGLGLYNYYVDTLSAFARVLRLVMGIPGGTKKEGVQQLRIGMEQGVLTRVEARYYLGKNLRNYDLDYGGSIEALSPLVNEFPGNPFFRLLLGDVQAKLGRRDLAAESFRAAAQLRLSDSACGERVRSLAADEIAALGARR